MSEGDRDLFPDSAEASNQIAEGWDLVFVDAEAGGADSGLELGRLLLRSVEVRQAVRRSIPMPKLVLVSSSLDEQQDTEAQNFGFSGTLLKPV